MADVHQELSGILEQKLRACDEFLCSTDFLLRAVESDDMAAVEHHLLRREELIGIISDIDRRIHHYRKKDLIDPHGTISESLTQLSGRIRDKLKRIVSVNGDCHDVTVGKLDATRRDLAALRQTKEGLHGYTPPKVQLVPKFLNVRT